MTLVWFTVVFELLSHQEMFLCFHVSCIGMRCYSPLRFPDCQALIMMHWWSDQGAREHFLPPLSDCLMSPGCSIWLHYHESGGFLPRSITSSDQVAIKRRTQPDSPPVWILRQTASLFFVSEFQLRCCVSVSSGCQMSWCPDSIIILGPSLQSPSAAAATRRSDLLRLILTGTIPHYRREEYSTYNWPKKQKNNFYNLQFSLYTLPKPLYKCTSSLLLHHLRRCHWCLESCCDVYLYSSVVRQGGWVSIMEAC